MICFEIAFVSGYSLVPEPPAKMIPFIVFPFSFLCFTLLNICFIPVFFLYSDSMPPKIYMDKTHRMGTTLLPFPFLYRYFPEYMSA